MTTGQKIALYGGISALAVLGIMAYMRTRGRQMKIMGETWTMGYLSARPNGRIPVHFNPRPAFDVLNAGDTVRISNTEFDGEYIVKDKWKDANGDLGAIYLYIPYKPTGTKDTKFDGIGKIEKLT